MSELGESYSGRIVARSVDATTDESKRIVAELGFNNHGLVIRSPAGETLWKQPDHQVVIEDVRAAIEDLTSRR